MCVYTANVILQMFHKVSTNNPLATGIPVLFVILIGMGKELYLEFRRWRDDKRVNCQPCLVLQSMSATQATESDGRNNFMNFAESQV